MVQWRQILRLRGAVPIVCVWGLQMKYLTSLLFLALGTVAARAGEVIPPRSVPEIDVLAGFAAVAVVGAVTAYLWERRR